MKDFTYDEQEIIVLRHLFNRNIETIVWDINGFYFNTQDETVKLECFDEIPEGRNDRFDELVCTRILKLDSKWDFLADSDSSYTIIARDVEITRIELLQAVVKFPEEIFIQKDKWNNDFGMNYISPGLLIWIEGGVIPAFVIRNWFGFLWQERRAILMPDELEIDETIRRVVLQ